MIPLLSSSISPRCLSSLLHFSVSFTSPLLSHVPRPLIFSFLKGCSSSVLGRRLQKPARRKQQEVGQQRPQQSNVWSLGMVPKKLLLLECAWLELPSGAENMFELLGPAMRPRWVAPRNTTSPCVSPGTWARRLLELTPACPGPCTCFGPLQHPTRAACCRG